MLSDNDFQHWCNRLKLSADATEQIQLIRSSEPSRTVSGGKRSVSGRYSSQKMGVTIQFESHKVELPFIYQLEHDEDVLEYYDQPPSFKLSYQSQSGKKIGFFYTPDFFVIRRDTAGWFECKTEEQLQKLEEKNPNRYFLDEEQCWRCPPAEEYAQQYGLDFSVWSSAGVNWTVQRNLEFLEDYYRVKTKKQVDITLPSLDEFNHTPNMISKAVKISPLNLSLVMSGYGAFSMFAQYSNIASLKDPIPK